jgi:hypothetical protein
MSKTAERDLEFMGKHLLKQPQLAGLRERMDSFAEEYGGTEDVMVLRKKLADDTQLSDIVKNDRDERL